MRTLVVGLGVQGHKRIQYAGKDFVASVDPINKDAHYNDLTQVPLEHYDAALLCIPDEPKIKLIKYLLQNRKHVLVEKPLFTDKEQEIVEVEKLAQQFGLVCYTAYNHRFEPHFARVKTLIQSGVLGEIYHCRMFYGNGTARLVKQSAWRDQGAGVLPDLGSHLLDTIHDWFGIKDDDFEIVSSRCFENESPDHVVFANFGTKPSLEMEMTLLSWRNHFTCDIFAEKGSAHISSLCKWGPTEFTYRQRVLPSGRPIEESHTLVQSDPTWALEYEHFKKLCMNAKSETYKTDLSCDLWISKVLRKLSDNAIETAKKSKNERNTQNFANTHKQNKKLEKTAEEVTPATAVERQPL